MRRIVGWFLYGLIIVISWAIGIGCFCAAIALIGSVVEIVLGQVGLFILGLIALLPGFVVFEVLSSVLADWLP
jgi:hypothetical protein